MTAAGENRAARPCTGMILVVDDDEAIRLAVALALREAGYQVATACNGRQALDWLHQQETHPCVILLDLMMPVMDGWEFRTRQNQDHRLSRVPVVVYSAYASHLPVKAVAVLAKSTPLEGLMSVVKRHAG
jgi:CheY-like chemotaxis protein